jgi:triosephosphate isomerase
MNLDLAGAQALAKGCVEAAKAHAHVDLAVCPCSVHLQSVGQIIKGSNVSLGAQNAYFEDNGAFTGEVSMAMLVDLGCKYVILGHSERRHVLGETDALINKKVKKALAAGLTPLVCVGELLSEREANQTGKVIREQFAGSLADLTTAEMERIVIAYEPVWAIGTGKVATTEQAEEVHLDLRKIMAERYNSGLSEKVRVLYGGSVKPSNAAQLLAQPNIDGALVGGASLKTEDFFGIVAGAAK